MSTTFDTGVELSGNDFALRIKRNAKISGFLFLLVILSSLLALLILDPRIQTIEDIVQNEIYFRIDAAYTLFMYIGVIFLATYLFRTLKHINKSLASVGWSLRLAEGILGGVKVLCFLIVSLLLNEENISKSFDVGQAHAFAEIFINAYWEMTIVIFAFLGLGSIVFFFLFYKSRYIPKAISIWGIISYTLVFLGSFISIIFDNNAYMILGSQTILFEIFIGAWLMFKGVEIPSTAQQST